jgi:predicted RNA-binding protein
LYTWVRKRSYCAIAKKDMGGKTDLERVVAYVPPEWKKELEAWAAKEERSVSWIVSKLIDKALQEHRQQEDDSKMLSLR